MIGSSFNFKYKSGGFFSCLIILFFINQWKIRLLLAEFGWFYRAHTYKGRDVTQCSMQIKKKKNLPVFFSSKWIAWDLQYASCPITQTTRTREQSTWIFYFGKGKATFRHFCWASCWSRGWGEAKFPLFAALTYAVQHFLSICLLYIKPSSSTQKYMS